MIGNDPEADKAFHQCLKLNPNHLAALNGLGQAALQRGQLAKAESWFLKAPEAPAAQVGMARLKLATGNYEACIRWATKALTASDSDEETRQWLQEMLDAAQAQKIPEDLKQSIKPSIYKPNAQQKNLATQANAQGWKLWQQQKATNAENKFRQAVGLNPKLAHAYNGLGWALIQQGLTLDAWPAFDACLALEPKHLGALNGKAMSLKANGKTDDAIKNWKHGIKAAPKQANALTSNLAQTYIEIDELEKAIPLLELHVKANPSDTYHAELLAKAQAAAKG